MPANPPSRVCDSTCATRAMGLVVLDVYRARALFLILAARLGQFRQPSPGKRLLRAVQVLRSECVPGMRTSAACSLQPRDRSNRGLTAPARHRSRHRAPPTAVAPEFASGERHLPPRGPAQLFTRRHCVLGGSPRFRSWPGGASGFTSTRVPSGQSTDSASSNRPFRNVAVTLCISGSVSWRQVRRVSGFHYPIGRLARARLTSRATGCRPPGSRHFTPREADLPPGNEGTP